MGSRSIFNSVYLLTCDGSCPIVLRPRIRSPCESNFPRAPTCCRGPTEGWLAFVIVIPQAFFDKTEGLSRAMFFLDGRNMVLGELLMG